MVPVIKNKQALMPCSEKRARKLMLKGEAKAYWQKGIFCISLIKEPSNNNFQAVVLGIDPGSKREGYTVATEKSVILNITSDTPNWVKDHVEARRVLRRCRRQRKTPYRSCRENRYSLRKFRVPPSTKSRWDTKLNMIKFLLGILPITIINVEDIKARTLKGKKKWNISFSPLEVGKAYFYQAIKDLNIQLILTEGYNTKLHRDKRGFAKSKAKLDFSWEAHNGDSHSLCEIVLQTDILPYLGLWQINYLQYYRRQLHVLQPIKNNIRKAYGTSISLGMPRGAVISYNNNLYYLGGSSKNMVAIHSIITGKRIKQYVKKEDINMLYTSNRRVQFLLRLKSWVSLHNFS